MSCPCKELERQFGGSDCKCVHYRQQFPNCQCENCSVSDHSPGPVQSDEVLVRTIFSPVQINHETGLVDPVHFRHDALKRGLSVNRKSHASEAALRTKIETKIARDKNEGKRQDDFYKAVTATCEDIRGLLSEEDGSRLFCVYDTATAEDPSHADVCQTLEPASGAANRRVRSMKISRELSKAFSGKATDLAAVYGGAG